MGTRIVVELWADRQSARQRGHRGSARGDAAGR